MMSHHSWADLSTRSKRLIALGSGVQLALLIGALVDISRRPRAGLHGPRAMWIGISFINFVGPITYFVAGRKHGDGHALARRGHGHS